MVVVEMEEEVRGKEGAVRVGVMEALTAMAVAATAEAEMKVEGVDTLVIRWEHPEGMLVAEVRAGTEVA